MDNQFEIISRLTSPDVGFKDKTKLLNRFAFEFDWRPSDYLEYPKLYDISNIHLIVEQGLQNSAVISFINNTLSYNDLNYSDRNSLLLISYNNLVDWHINVELNKVSIVYNRIDPPKIVEEFNLTKNNYDKLRREAFNQIIGKKPSPNLPSLDDAFIRTISYWKKILTSELRDKISNLELSILFNSIIFIRAIEDLQKRKQEHKKEVINEDLVLLKALKENKIKKKSLKELISISIKEILNIDLPGYLFDINKLNVFNNLDELIINELINDFYVIKYAKKYKYDFSVISKSALSKIYENYVSILRTKDEAQQSFLPLLPYEESDKSYGNVYTPQYIARFFARYIRENISPVKFKKIKVIDPSCGSGIFLRTILELQCDPSKEDIETKEVKKSFSNVFGIDINESAVQATKLSLSLLYLILYDKLPEPLNIVCADSIDYIKNKIKLKNSFDAILANPPFVSYDNLNEELRKKIYNYLGKYGTGRIDLYLPFLKMGIDLLKPGGLGLFILPNSFLFSNNSKSLRELLYSKCWIRCIVDLSSIDVFENLQTYVILIIFEKKSKIKLDEPKATILKCQDLVGLALQDIIDDNFVENNYYMIYELEQIFFKQKKWQLMPPKLIKLKSKFDKLKKIEDFLHVREGFISGVDDVFIIDKNLIYKGEEKIFVPYLHDRSMLPYNVPKKTDKYFFYPYLNGKKLKEHELKEKFPITWKYLLSNKEKLSKRNSVRKSNTIWWHPTRPRQPYNMLVPKIISPYLVLYPRFSLDFDGKYAISHSPLLYLKDKFEDNELLKYFLAILNSSPFFWYLENHSIAYKRGYLKLEPKILKCIPVPDPFYIPSFLIKHIISLVNFRLQEKSKWFKIEKEIDIIVADLYNLNKEEKKIVGVRQ